MKKIVISLIIALMLCTIIAPSASAQLPIPPYQATWPPDQQLLYVTFVAHVQRDLALTTDYVIIRCIDTNPDSYWMGCEYSYMIEKQNQWTLLAQLPPSKYEIFLDTAPKVAKEMWKLPKFEVGAMQNMMVEFNIGDPTIPSDATPTPLGGLIIPTPTPNPNSTNPDATVTPAAIEMTKVPHAPTSSPTTPAPTMDTTPVPTPTPTPTKTPSSLVPAFIAAGVCVIGLVVWAVYKVKRR